MKSTSLGLFDLLDHGRRNYRLSRDFLARNLIFDFGFLGGDPAAAAGFDQAASGISLAPSGLDEAFAASGLDETGHFITAHCLLGPGLGGCGPPGRAPGGQCSLGRDLLATGGGQATDDVTSIDPDLDPDGPDRGAGGGHAVVDVGPQSVERNPALPVPLATTHVGSSQAAVALDSDPLGAGLEGGGNRSLHGSAEGDPVLELVGDALGEQLGVEVGILDLGDVQLDRLAGDHFEAGPQPLRLGPLRPMTTPGRAVWISTTTRSRVRSMSIRETAPRLSSLRR